MTEDEEDKLAEQAAERREAALAVRIAVEAALDAGTPLSELYGAVTDAFEARRERVPPGTLIDEDAPTIKPGLDDTPETVNVGE